MAKIDLLTSRLETEGMKLTATAYFTMGGLSPKIKKSKSLSPLMPSCLIQKTIPSKHKTKLNLSRKRNAERRGFAKMSKPQLYQIKSAQNQVYLSKLATWAIKNFIRRPQ